MVLTASIAKRRKHHGIERAVMQARLLERAHRVGHGVDRAQALLKRHGALHAGHHHLPERLAVGALGDRALEVPDRTTQAVEPMRYSVRCHRFG